MQELGLEEYGEALGRSALTPHDDRNFAGHEPPVASKVGRMTTRITVYEQGNPDNKQNMSLPANATVESVMRQAAKALNVSLPKKGAKLFFENGSTVDDIELLRNNDVISLSVNAAGQICYSIAVMGPGAVGKSAITLSYVQNQFVIDYDPTIEDAYRKNDSVDGMPCMMDILDTAGQDDYSALRTTWMQSRDAFVLVFSVADYNSYQELANFYDQLMVVHEGQVPPLVLVGNKCDLKDRKVSTEQGKELAEAWSAMYIETSAKTGENIKELFHRLVRKVRSVNARRRTLEEQKEATQMVKKKWFCTII